MTQDLDATIKWALDGIETLLHAKSVVGDPVTLGEYTLGREQAQQRRQVTGAACWCSLSPS